jgi:hypothetical protein
MLPLCSEELNEQTIPDILSFPGSKVNVKSSAIRAISVTSYLTATVVMAAYSAVFISYLTVQDLQLPVATFRDLLQDGRYHLLAVTGTAQLNYFDVSAQAFVFSYNYWLGGAN